MQPDNQHRNRNINHDDDVFDLLYHALFDPAAFINSLDLSAAIIATYTNGDLEFLYFRRGKRDREQMRSTCLL
jgi:hypothetical protein